MTMETIYKQLLSALKDDVRRHNLEGQSVQIRCKALSAQESIGNPDHDDYPISKGKEVMIEAVFQQTRGQAFTGVFVNQDYRIQDLMALDFKEQKNRASFIAALNAIYRYLSLCDKTIHCRDEEPVVCAKNLVNEIADGTKVLLVGHQPRFLEVLASRFPVRVVDLDEDNVGRDISGVRVEPQHHTAEASRWCDLIFATGSTVVNGTIEGFLNQKKPVLFYGVTISAAARILNLQTYCHCGH